MEKAARIRQLIDARTALLDAVSGLCEEDFEAAFGEGRLSLKRRLAHIAVVDWDVAKSVREMARGSEDAVAWALPAIRWGEDRARLVETRCCSSGTEIVSEVVLSLQALLDELRSVPDERFLKPAVSESGSAISIASLVDVALRCTQQHYEEVCSWRSE